MSVPVLVLYFGGEFFSVYAIRLGVMDVQTQLLTNTQYIYTTIIDSGIFGEKFHNLQLFCCFGYISMRTVCMYYTVE